VGRWITYGMRLVTLLVVAIGLYVAIIFFAVEQVFPFYPEIDTQFSANFSKSKFEAVSAGMSAKEVEALLGEPFTRTEGGWGGCWDGSRARLSEWLDTSEGSFEIPLPPESLEKESLEVWSYSKDGACSWFDFAWLEYRIEMQNGIVTKKERCWHGD
jgi:hypothetical protein